MREQETVPSYGRMWNTCGMILDVTTKERMFVKRRRMVRRKKNYVYVWKKELCVEKRFIFIGNDALLFVLNLNFAFLGIIKKKLMLYHKLLMISINSEKKR